MSQNQPEATSSLVAFVSSELSEIKRCYLDEAITISAVCPECNHEYESACTDLYYGKAYFNSCCPECSAEVDIPTYEVQTATITLKEI